MVARRRLSRVSEGIALCGLSQEEAAALFGVPVSTLKNWVSETARAPDYIYDRLAQVWDKIEYGTSEEGLSEYQVLRRSVLADLRGRSKLGDTAIRAIRVPGNEVMTVEVRDVTVTEDRVDAQVVLSCAGKSRQTRFQTGWDPEAGRVKRDAASEVKIFRRLNNSVHVARMSWVSALRHVVPAWRREERLEANEGETIDAVDVFMGDVHTLVADLIDQVSKFQNPSIADLRRALGHPEDVPHDFSEDATEEN